MAKELPLLYRKVLDIIDDTPTDRRTTIEEEIVRRFRLNKDECDLILKDCDERGLIKRGRFSISDVKV